jgi:putative ABC transport system permease protein
MLLRPLVNRDEGRLIYIRQSAPGAGTDNADFSMPEIADLRARVKTLNSFGDLLWWAWGSRARYRPEW